MKTLSREVAAAEQEILLSVLCVRRPYKDRGHPLPLPCPEITIVINSTSVTKTIRILELGKRDI